MKVIDLLNKIANGEEIPTLVKFRGYIYTYDKNICDYSSDDLYLFDNTDKLNDEVEIIEEDKKIEPLMNCINAIRPNEMTSYYEKEKLEDIVKHNFDVIHKKINEIIDYLEEKE